MINTVVMTETVRLIPNTTNINPLSILTLSLSDLKCIAGNADVITSLQFDDSIAIRCKMKSLNSDVF